MASTTPSVSFPVRWSSFITIETREPRLILARSCLPYWAIYLSYYYVVAQSEGSCRQTYFVSKAADAFYDSGKLYHIDGHHELAIQDCTEAIRLDPQYAIAYYTRGYAYYDLGQYERSIQDYDEAIRLDPLDAIAYHWRGFA